VKHNIVVVGQKEDKSLFGKTITTTGWHWIGKSYKLSTKVTAKIRYRQEPQEATLKEDRQKDIAVNFKEKQWAIAPGQTIVAYKGDECIGSGIITG
jgi:tRNA-specific 2-thiouridylase